MKALILAVALMTGAAANAEIAFPLWGCKLKATVTDSSSIDLLVIRGETAHAKGVAKCMTALGQTSTQKVDVVIQSGGIGPAINGNLEGLTIYAARTGVATTNGMYGVYQLSAGPRLGLLKARVGVMAGVQISGEGVGAGVEAVIENRFSFGLDLGGMAMAIVPAGQGHNYRFPNQEN